MKLRDHLATISIGVAVCLFAIAASYYPGGTTDSATTVGYSWTHNFVSSLFAPRALNGAANPARYVAMLAMLVLCTGIGLMFRKVSTRVSSRAHRKTIEIAGIGSIVYGFLVITPMHDLMVTISLLFSLTALLATTHALYLDRRPLLFGWGVLCVALCLLTAGMYYGHAFYFYLPIVQKVSLVASITWLISVCYSKNSGTETIPSGTLVADVPGE